MPIVEAIERLEAYRKELNTYGMIMGGSAVLMFIMPILLSSTGNVNLAGFLMFATMGIVIFFSFKYSQKNSECKMIYKTRFVKGVLDEVFTDVNYQWSHGFTESTVRDICLPRMGNRFNSEDYLRASYDGISFEQADATIKYKSSGKNSHTTTYFKGRMFIFNIPSKCLGDVRICSKNFTRDLSPRLSAPSHKIELENVDFNQVFEVFTTSDHDAFYLITPQVMERIMGLYRKYTNIAIRFTYNAVYIAYNTSDNAFDLNLRQQVNYYDLKQEIHDDAMEIVQLIETLKMNTD